MRYVNTAKNATEFFDLNYEALNTWMRFRTFSNRDEKEMKYLIKWANCLQNVLLSAPNLPKDTILYRGISGDNIFKDIKIGDTWKTESFLSTTTNFVVSQDFIQFSDCCLLELHMKNITGVYIKSMDEDEVLLPAGISFIYDGTYKCEDGEDNIKSIHRLIQK
jgi:hypothetical protein